tara:strand:- start:782 stop:967 length:186 start_codon:yes stop_codon:yes gene_type:complete
MIGTTIMASANSAISASIVVVVIVLYPCVGVGVGERVGSAPLSGVLYIRSAYQSALPSAAS